MTVFPLARYLDKRQRHSQWPKECFSQRQKGSHSYIKNKRIKMPRTGPYISQNFLKPEKHLFIPRLLTEQQPPVRHPQEGAKVTGCHTSRRYTIAGHTNYLKRFPGLQLMTASLGGFPPQQNLVNTPLGPRRKSQAGASNSSPGPRGRSPGGCKA